MSRFLGRHAEKRFSALCSYSSVTCNSSQEDDHGWDHLIEFPILLPDAGPADERRAMPGIFVQTKLAGLGERRVRMKLSNALKLSRSPNPCFLVVADRSDKDGAGAWYAVHFWRDEVGHTLKRARQASKAGTVESEFNRIWISFPLRERDRCSDSSLLPWIERTVRELGLDYSGAKRELYEKVGRPLVVAELHLSKEATTRQLLDYQLGLSDENPIDTVRIARWRFGVDLDLPEEEAEVILEQLRRAEAEKCVVELVGPDGERVSLESEVVRPNVFNLEDGDFKAVVRTRILELTITDGASITANVFSLTEQRTPQEFEQISRLMGWAGAGPIEMAIDIGGIRTLIASIEVEKNGEEKAYSTLLPFFTHLRRISEGHSPAPTVSMRNIADGIFTAEFLRFLEAARFKINTNVLSKSPPPQCDSVVAFGATGIGDWIFAAIVLWEVEKDGRARRWTFNAVRPRMIKRFCYPLLDDPELLEVKRQYELHASEPGVTGLGPLKEITGFSDLPGPPLLKIN